MAANAISLLTVSLLGCPFVSSKPIPKWDGKLYAGNSKEQEVTRAQANEHIKCSDPKFDAMTCMSYRDLEKFYETYVEGCKVWKEVYIMVRPQDQIRTSSPFVGDKNGTE